MKQIPPGGGRRSSTSPRTPFTLVRLRGSLREGRNELHLWARGHSATLITLVSALLLFFLFSRILFQRGPSFALAAVFLLTSFLGTLFLLEIGVAILILSMLFSPEVSMGTLGVKSLTLRIEDLLIPLIVLAWLARKALGVDRRELRLDPLFVLMALFLGEQVLVTFAGWEYHGIHFQSAIFHILKQAEYFAIFFFTFQYLDSKRKVALVLFAALLTAVFLSLYNLVLIPGSEVWTRHRLSAPFEGATPEPSSLGGYFLIALSLLLAFASEAPAGKWRNWLLVAAALIFIPFLYTLSRTSYVAFLAMILCLAWYKRSLRVAGMLGLALVLSPFLLPSEVIDRILFTFRDTTKVFGIFDRSLGERLFIWYKVYFNLTAYPLFGRGVTTEDVIDSYYARVLLETGLVGLGLFTAIIVRLFQLARLVRRSHPEWWARAFALGYSTCLVGLLFHALSAITFVIVRIMEPFWLMTGILAALAWRLPGPQEASPAPVERAPLTARVPSPVLGRKPIHG